MPTKTKAPDIVEVIRDHVDDFEKEIEAHKKQALTFIKQNPLTSVLGALALGYLLARLTGSHDRVIYVEKPKV